jgi:uncharacterized membrane protein
LDFAFLVLPIPSIYKLIDFLSHLHSLLFSGSSWPFLLLADQIL